MNITERALVLAAKIAELNPISYSDTWGYVDCFFCDSTERGDVTEHEPDCMWLEACDLASIEHPQHLVVTYGPHLDPPLNGQIIDLSFTYGNLLPDSAYERTIRKVDINGRERWGFPWRTPDDGTLRLAIYDSIDTARAALALTPA